MRLVSRCDVVTAPLCGLMSVDETSGSGTVTCSVFDVELVVVVCVVSRLCCR